MPSLFQILSALSAAIGLVSGYIQIREAIRAHPGTPPQRRRFTWIVTITAFLLTLVFLVASLAPPPVTQAPSSNTSSSTTPQSGTENAPTQAASAPTVIPSPTPIAKSEPGTVLCQADTSRGWNGWNGTSDWKVFNGTLLNDGTKWMSQLSLRHPTIVAPCDLSASPDYAVEVTMQITTPPNGDACFGIYVRGNSTGGTWQGYAAVVNQACVSGALNTVRISVDEDQQSQWLSTVDPFVKTQNLRM